MKLIPALAARQERVRTKFNALPTILKIGVLLCVLFATYQAYTLIRDKNMKTLVYLIPEEFFGGVNVVFNQPDGLPLEDDPLQPNAAYVIRVPENGVVTIRDKPNFKAGKTPQYGTETFVFMSVNQRGQRTQLPRMIESYLEYDETIKNRVFFLNYIDAKGMPQTKRIGEFPSKLDDVGMMQTITGNQRIVYGHGSRIGLGFFKRADYPLQPGEYEDDLPKGVSPTPCGGFWVGTPEQSAKSAALLMAEVDAKNNAWNALQNEVDRERFDADTSRWLVPPKHFDSAQDLIDFRNRYLERKRKDFNLKPWYSPYEPFPPKNSSTP